MDLDFCTTVPSDCIENVELVKDDSDIDIELVLQQMVQDPMASAVMSHMAPSALKNMTREKGKGEVMLTRFQGDVLGRETEGSTLAEGIERLRKVRDDARAAFQHARVALDEANNDLDGERQRQRENSEELAVKKASLPCLQFLLNIINRVQEIHPWNRSFGLSPIDNGSIPRTWREIFVMLKLMEEEDTDLQIARATLLKLGREELQSVRLALANGGFHTSPRLRSLWLLPPPGHNLATFNTVYGPNPYFTTGKLPSKDALQNTMLDLLGFGQERTEEEKAQAAGENMYRLFRRNIPAIAEVSSAEEED